MDLEACNSGDFEGDHCEADKVLKLVALSTTLTIEERNYLVELYDKVGKWYA